MLGLISIFLFFIIAVLGFIANRLRKGRMQKALGREVNEYELNSINSWMQVAENEDKRGS